MQEQLKAAAPHADGDRRHARGPAPRDRATSPTNYEHIPAELLAHQMRGAAGCDGVRPLIEYALREGWTPRRGADHLPGAGRLGHRDRLLPWPSAAARYRDDWLPHADWVELDGVGHCPQLDVPLETAQLILGFTRGGRVPASWPRSEVGGRGRPPPPYVLRRRERLAAAAPPGRATAAAPPPPSGRARRPATYRGRNPCNS